MSNQPSSDFTPVFTGEPRFDSKIKVNPETGCWEWTARTDQDGYGLYTRKGRSRRAHRHSYELLVEAIPYGLHLDHLCRNRKCVNPNHLEPVTCAENNWRSPVWNGNKTHCHHGHEYTPENTGWYSSDKETKRYCRACTAARNKAYRARKRNIFPHVGKADAVRLQNDGVLCKAPTIGRAGYCSSPNPPAFLLLGGFNG